MDGGAQLGFQFGKLDKYHAKVGFNLAAIEKTVKGKAVNNLLINPATTSLSMYADGAYWFYNLFKSKVLLGPYGRFGLASSEFMITEEDLNPISGSLLHLSTGLSFISKPFRFDLGDEKDNVMQIGLEIGYGYRGIVGTIAFDKNIDRRNEILGFNNTSLGNFESTIHLRYNNIRPFARITGFNLSDRNGSKVEIDDLSGFQVFWGVDILTNIVSKSIN